MLLVIFPFFFFFLTASSFKVEIVFLSRFTAKRAIIRQRETNPSIYTDIDVSSA